MLERLTRGSASRYSRIGQTFRAAPAEPGGLPRLLEREFDHNAYLHIQVPFVTFRGVTGSEDATFNIFSERTSELVGWRISYSNKALLEQEPDNPLPNRVKVRCASFPVEPCIAWSVDKNFNPVAAVVGGGTKENPDAGAWLLPFGIAVCLRDHEEFASPPAGFTKGEWCKSYVSALW